MVLKKDALESGYGYRWLRLWICSARLGPEGAVPDHPTFSKNR
jgi:hypothetical protein